MMKVNNIDEEILRARRSLETYLPDSPLTVDKQLRLIAELKLKMQDDVVHFVFRKIDGTERHAFGTRAKDILDNYISADLSVGQKAARKVAFGTFSYFDIERKDWRCFRVDRLVEIKNDYVL